MFRILIGTAVIGLAAFSAGQVKISRSSGNTETMNKVKPGMAINSQDRAFFKQALETNLVELKLGQLAQQKGSGWTKDYGLVMEQEHAQGFNELKVIGQKLKLPVSKNLSSENKNLLSRMARMSRGAFEREYRGMMIKGHNAFLMQIEREVKFGNNSLIRNHAVTLGPVVRLHEKMAQRKVTKL